MKKIISNMQLKKVSYSQQRPCYSENKDIYILNIYDRFGQRKNFHWYTIHKKVPKYIFWFFQVGYKYKRLIGPIFPEKNLQETKELGQEHLKCVFLNL